MKLSLALPLFALTALCCADSADPAAIPAGAPTDPAPPAPAPVDPIDAILAEVDGLKAPA